MKPLFYLTLWFIILVPLTEGISCAQTDETFLLIVSDLKDGNIYYSIPILPSDGFSVEFLHSYDRFPYRDDYQVRGDGKIIYVSAGGRSLLNGQGFFYTGFHWEEGGFWKISHINEIRSDITFIMGSRSDANHHLILKNETVELSKKIPSGKFVKISIQPSLNTMGK
jgi:hypothetical protein